MTNSKYYPYLDVSSMYVPPMRAFEQANVEISKPVRGSVLPPANRALRKALENALAEICTPRQEARRMIGEVNAELIKSWKRKARSNMRRRVTNAELDVNPFIAPWMREGLRFSFVIANRQKYQRIVITITNV